MKSDLLNHPYLHAFARLADLHGSISDSLLADIRTRSAKDEIAQSWQRVGDALWESVEEYEEECRTQ